MSFSLCVFLGIACIILASGIAKAIQARAETAGAADDGQLARVEERMGALEARLGDIQEIVLAADEKLERLEGQLLNQTRPE